MGSDNGPNGEQPLRSLIPAEWYSIPEASSVWLRIYAPVGASHAKLEERFGETVSEGVRDGPVFVFDQPVAIGLGALKGMKAPRFAFEISSDSSGGLRIHLHTDDRELPESLYIFLLTPYRRDGVEVGEDQCRRLLDMAAGLLTMHLGLNFVRALVFEGQLAAHDGSFTAPSEPFRVPQPGEGPFLSSQYWADIQEVCRRLCNCRQKRGRIELALQLFEEAVRDREGFLKYWIALEVVVDGRAGRVADRLREIYDFKNHKEAEEGTGFTVLKTWRRGLVHAGQRPPITFDVERWIQMMFLDLLRWEIDLAPRFHLGRMLKTPGYDLRPIGLPDNRTEEQRGVRPERETEPRTQNRLWEE